MLPKQALIRFVSLMLLAAFAIGCGGVPTTPDTSREEKEQRQNDAFRELK